MPRILRRLERTLLTTSGRRRFRRNARFRRFVIAVFVTIGAAIPVTYTDGHGHRHTCLYDQRLVVVPCTDGHVDLL